MRRTKIISLLVIMGGCLYVFFNVWFTRSLGGNDIWALVGFMVALLSLGVSQMLETLDKRYNEEGTTVKAEKICDSCTNDTSDYTEYYFQEKSGAVTRNTNWVLCNTCRKRAPAVRLDTRTTFVVLKPVVETEEENPNGLND